MNYGTNRKASKSGRGVSTRIRGQGSGLQHDSHSPR